MASWRVNFEGTYKVIQAEQLRVEWGPEGTTAILVLYDEDENVVGAFNPKVHAVYRHDLAD